MGWNPLKAVKSFVSDAVNFVSDAFDYTVDLVVDVVESAIGFLTPEIDVPDFGEINADQTAKGVLVNKFSANSFIPVVYGTRKVGGNVVFLETSGADNQYLYMAIILSEGEIDSVQTLIVNDQQVTLTGALTNGTQRSVANSDANFYDGGSLITVQAHLGSDTQIASNLLDQLGSWTTNHTLSGLAYIALKFEWNADKFGSLPKVQAVVKGRKVYNPNLDGTVTGGSGSHRKDDSSTWAYSDNPILQLLDYLRNNRFGMGIANSYFDTNFADWQTASDVCDTQITPFSGASQIDLMNSHAVVDTSKKAINNVKDFIRGCRGYLNFTAGKYNILVETTGSASISLTEDNIIGGISVSSKSKNSRYNRVIVTFINPDKDYQSDTAQFPPVDETGLVSADQHSTMKTADGDLLLEGRFDFSMLTSPYQAQEMAEIILRRSRTSLDISIQSDASALDLAIGDIVNITHATPSFSAKPFRVQGMTINSDMTVSLQCTEHQDSFYTFGLQIAVPEIPDTTLPNPFLVQSPSIEVSDELRVLNEEAISVLIVDVASSDLFTVDFEVQAKKTTDANYINMGKASGKRFELINVKDGIAYDVRARTITSISRSVFIATTHQIVGKTAPPETITNFSVNIVNTDAHLSWTPVGDLDLSHYRIRHSRDTTTSATYANSVDIEEKVARPANTAVVPAMTGTYFIKAVDKLGNESLDATSSVAIIEDIKGLNAVVTTTQNPTFSGTKNTTVVVGNELRLGTSILFDSGAGNFDTTGGLFDGGGGKIASSGTYDFDNYVDLGAVFTSRVTQNVVMRRVSFGLSFDDATGNFDDREGLFDGDTNEFGDTNVEVQIATTEDDPSSGSPTYTAFRKFIVGDYKARAFKFKALLTSKDSEASPSVSTLSIEIDMPDRVIADNDIVSGTGSKAVTFTPTFKGLQGIGITAQNLASGDYYAITSKSTSGFTITFYNSSNSEVNRTFDYVAKGFGELVT